MAVESSMKTDRAAPSTARHEIRILHDRGYIAEEYPAFLNQTAERNLLRKVGGGYTFVHALLLQYFSGRA